MVDGGDPLIAGFVIVCRWGLRFPAAGVIVYRWGHPATRNIHANPYIRPACARGDGEDGGSTPGHRTGLAPRAEAVGYASDPERHLSATPPTPIDDVAGVADRPGNLSLA